MAEPEKPVVQLTSEHAAQATDQGDGSNSVAAVNAYLTSGDSITIKSILLYPANKLQSAQAMLMDAKSKLGGVSSGIGFFGSPGWVISGALLTGFLEHVAGRANASEGVRIMQQAEILLQQIREEGRWFPTNCISNVQYPLPNLWFFEQKAELLVRGLLRDKTLPRITRFIHNGEPYFRVKTKDGDECCVLLDKIERWATHVH